MYYHYGKWRQAVLFSEVTNVLSLWEVEGLCSEAVLFSEVTNVLSLWEVGLCSEAVLFSEVTNVLSLWEVDKGCPLFRRVFR